MENIFKCWGNSPQRVPLDAWRSEQEAEIANFMYIPPGIALLSPYDYMACSLGALKSFSLNKPTCPYVFSFDLCARPTWLCTACLLHYLIACRHMYNSGPDNIILSACGRRSVCCKPSLNGTLQLFLLSCHNRESFWVIYFPLYPSKRTSQKCHHLKASV